MNAYLFFGVPFRKPSQFFQGRIATFKDKLGNWINFPGERIRIAGTICRGSMAAADSHASARPPTIVLKGSQHGGGKQLAAHLMKLEDNKHIHVYDRRGFMSDNLYSALHEANAVNCGTRATQFLFSVKP